MKTRSWLAVLALAAASLNSGEPHARTARSACLDRQLAGATAQGWRTRGVDTDSALPGDHASYEMTFYKGSRYLYLACTDDGDATLSLTLTDPSGKLVGEASEKGTTPLLELKARTAGSHILEVHVESKLEGKPTWFSLAMLYR